MKKAIAQARAKEAIGDDATFEDGPSSITKMDTAESPTEDFPNSLESSTEFSLFSDERSSLPGPDVTLSAPYPVTPTVTCSPSSLPQNASPQPDPPVPTFISFVCSLTLPWILHNARVCGLVVTTMFILVILCDSIAIFLGVGYEWEQEISMLDLIGGGRLGTAVKKGFLIGGKDPNTEVEEGGGTRTFAIEWGGM